jgi:AcrR family transcriptional regulator
MDPRVERTRQAVFDAIQGLLEQGGPDAVTYSAVAARSGVGRATLYRHWSRREDLIGDIVRQGTPPPGPWVGELRADLATALIHAADVLATPVGTARLITPADRGQHDADARQIVAVLRERHSVRAALELAQHNGQLAKDVSIDLAQALLLGPVLYQRVWTTSPIDACFIDRVVEAFMTAQDNRSDPTSRRETKR